MNNQTNNDRLIRRRISSKRQLVSSRKVHEDLGIGQNFTNWFKRKIESLDLREGLDFKKMLCKSTGGRRATDFLISKDTAIQIAMKSTRNEHSSKLVAHLSQHMEKVFLIRERPREEKSFGLMLDLVFKGFVDFKPQHFICGYRIDFYSKKYNLAIEHDGKYHLSDTQSTKDFERQKQLTEKFGFHFIRVNQGSEYEGINAILKYVIEKEMEYARVN